VSSRKRGNGRRALARLPKSRRLKQAERSGAESEERFRRAFEDSGAGMALVAVDPECAGKIGKANGALAELTGYPREELEEMDLDAIVHPEDVAALAQGIHELATGERETLRMEHRVLTATGMVRWVMLSTSIVNDASGNPVHRLVQLQDISERKRFEGQLQYLADHDPLTGLFNRRRFEQELERELESSRRYGTGGALLVLDLDNFRYVNDSLGHPAGDELISSVGHALSHRLRNTDTVGRLGGDEFGVILPYAGEEDAVLVATGVVEVIRDAVSIEAEHGRRRTTASVGVALFPEGEERMSAEELLVEGDIAMYDAKEAGRDRVAVFALESDRHQKMEVRLSWAERIRTALREDSFVLHAQPIVSLGEDDGVPRYELLLRMIDPDGDLIPPGTFLYVAERFGLIEEVDRWVVREAMRLLAIEERAGRRASFSVNLSAKSIQDPKMTEFIARRLAATGVDPRGLIFEVTETVAIENVDRAKQFARDLRSLGSSFALDDFGSGFASFYYLKHLQFDYLKIDGEFVRNLPQSRTDQLVVRSLVDIASGLGRQTIAEYVENQETLEMLRSYGVDFVQGFHLGGPAPFLGAGTGPRASAGEKPRRTRMAGP
jgi:diguanylate cyclase (GGDEF)-like protein/PAS domain S-box-containing protein